MLWLKAVITTSQYRHESPCNGGDIKMNHGGLISSLKPDKT
ncbi:MAG: hypothetical protein MORG_01849 [Morganella sp. (in: enterobacteria)]